MEHVKLPAGGGGAVPGEHLVSRFYQEVDNFLEENEDNDDLLGVHCTHGINRWQ